MKLLEEFDIQSKKELWVLFKQFVKFGVVGFSNTVISLAIYYIFVLVNRELYIVGNTTGFVVSVLNAYYWNHKYVFQKPNKGHVKYLLRTFVGYGCTFGLSTFLLFIMVQYLGISQMVAPVINLMITVPLNFLINKFWTFKIMEGIAYENRGNCLEDKAPRH